MAEYGPLRPEIKPSGHAKLARAGAALNRSPNDVLNRLVDLVEEIQITEIVTIKMKAEPESPSAQKGRHQIVIKKSSIYRSEF